VPTQPFTIHAVTSERWADFERLFEAKGGPKYCWCMAWRSMPEDTKQADGSQRKAALAARVADGVPIGLLGYLEEQPVAWCSIAPRSTYRRLVSNATPNDGVWSIVCFFVLRQHRGAGLTKRMLAAALKHAREEGAKVVEAYPVDEDSPSYRFMGFVPMFQEAGFHEIGREGSRRHVMQRQLRP
jgi:GNAT superfamily N-acetyltransferase